MRERRRKRSRKPEGHTRQGYHSDWKEPKLFTMYAMDSAGHVVKTFDPFPDATLGDHEAMFAVLEDSVVALGLDEVARVVFCGDGAPWIWHGVEALRGRLGLASDKVSQVLDSTHANQNLATILALLPKRQRSQKREARWKGLVWQGDIAALRQEIMGTFTSKSRRERALHKWQSSFDSHAKRMQYESFEAQGLPCGSGCVERAIRRVINLRLKAPGTFWTREMGACMRFLRCQLLSGRWQVMLHNIITRTAKQLRFNRVMGLATHDYAQRKAA